MAKPELGTKRVCVSCGAKFYDLAKAPAICPKCGAEQPADLPRPRRTGGNVAEEKRVKKPAPDIDDGEVEAEVADEDEAEDVLEDTSDLEDDADAIGTDIEVEPESDEKDM